VVNVSLTRVGFNPTVVNVSLTRVGFNPTLVNVSLTRVGFNPTVVNVSLIRVGFNPTVVNASLTRVGFNPTATAVNFSGAVQPCTTSPIRRRAAPELVDFSPQGRTHEEEDDDEVGALEGDAEEPFSKTFG
jgi:hypothetical protein